MNDDLRREYGRWLDADRDGRDDDADEALRTVFGQAVTPPAVPVQFAGRTIARIADVRAADARRSRQARLALLWAGATAGPVAVYFGAGAIMSAAATLLLGALNLLVQGIVRLMSMSDWNVWSLVGSMGRALAAVMADSDVTIVMLAMHGIAVAALVALQRLLGPET